MRPGKEAVGMTQNNVTTIDELWEAACCRFPALSPEEQRAGIVLLRELASGEHVAIAQLARALGAPLDAAEVLMKNSALSPFVHADDAWRIQGFWCLAASPT